MIKMLVAHTLELDDPEAAVSEILEQLDLEHRLLKHSVGIMVCYLDFMEEGIVKAICDRLPFDVLGINTLSSATPEEAGQLLLGLTVLTSDDVSFATGLSEVLEKGKEGRAGELFTKTAQTMPDKPSMIMAFAPIFMEFGGDTLVDQLDAASGGLPIFGSLAIDITTEYRDPRIIYNGQTWKDRIAIILLAGDFVPEFSVISISENKIRRQKIVVTKSQANMIMELNDQPVGDYLESIGLAQNGRITGVGVAKLPLILDYNDNTDPVARSILFQSPEGYLIYGGNIPQNCSASLGFLDAEEVFKTTSEIINRLKGTSPDGLLMFSCAARNFALGLDSMAELHVVREALGRSRPYMLAYSSGEICPVKTYDGKLKNRFHNVTFISCSFK